MNRVLVAALCCTAFFALSHGRAQALTEFCPAGMSIKPVGTNGDGLLGDTTASLYGFELTAMGARTVSGTLAFDTDKGWYTAQVPAVPLAAKVRHYSTPYVKYTEQDFVSQRMYVRFPNDVRLFNTWLYRAAASDDGPFGWQARGTVSCMPRPKRDIRTKRRRSPLIKLDPADDDRLSDAPRASSTVLDAKASSALFSENCPEPFKDAVATAPVTPQWPIGLRPAAETSSVVMVAVNADGSVADAWIDGPSGYQQFDAEAVDAAKHSKYTGALAYCQAVPGTYLFNVTWSLH